MLGTGCRVDKSFFEWQEVFRYKVVEENRHMWRVLLAKKRYDQALLFCKNDPLKLDKVWFRQAQDLFSEGLYEEAALKFSDTFSSFEEVRNVFKIVLYCLESSTVLSLNE